MTQDEKRQNAIGLLQKKAGILQRLPQRSDFTGDEVCFVKQKRGPGPRALEAAGLKEPPAVSAKEKSRLKRERCRREQKKIRKALKASETTEEGVF